jgi:sugar lactone lactonase YvrE
MHTPIGLACDRSGNLYVANAETDTIEKFSPTGTDLGVFASTGNGTGPWGLAFDSSGDLYAVTMSGGKIEEFSPTGTDLGVFASTGLNTPGFIAIQQVPEPSTFILAGLGLLGALTLRRRRR